MIFNTLHIYQIKRGIKTQTRRKSKRYEPERVYQIQSGRGKFGIKEGVLIITKKRCETYEQIKANPISIKDAAAEGSGALGFYTPFEYEKLYETLYPGWKIRYVYDFIFVPRIR